MCIRDRDCVLRRVIWRGGRTECGDRTRRKDLDAVLPRDFKDIVEPIQVDIERVLRFYLANGGQYRCKMDDGVDLSLIHI